MRNSFFERILSLVVGLCVFLSLVVAFITVFASLSGEESDKEILGFRFLIVASDSMTKSPSSETEPIFFKAGDLIAIKKVNSPETLTAGDVISFHSYNPDSYGKTVTHKIREIRYDRNGGVLGFVTYGINTGANDTVLVKPENIIGKYLFKIPDAGALFAFLKTPRAYFTLILIPFVSLIIFFSIKIGKYLGSKNFRPII